MALPKHKRKIVVNHKTYYWIAKGKLEVINLSIEDAASNKLFAKFDYNTIDDNGSYFVFPFVVTPYILFFI